MPEEQLTIGELAQRTGVATSALRYWEECGLLPPSTVGLVGEILLLRDVGFTLREVKALIAARSQAGDGWRELHQRKLTELDQRKSRSTAPKMPRRPRGLRPRPRGLPQNTQPTSVSGPPMPEMRGYQCQPSRPHTTRCHQLIAPEEYCVVCSMAIPPDRVG
jgi:DNA-binding transcriptional MerR regulator